MNKRDLGKLAVLGTAVAAIVPNAIAKVASESTRDFSDRRFMEELGYTSEQISAVERLYAFESHVRSLLPDVVNEFPQTVPDGNNNPGWKHGSFRVFGWIGGFPTYSIDNQYPVLGPNDDISDIRCTIAWR